MVGPRTTREALIAEILGDVDGLLSRAETLPALIAAAEEKMTNTAKALDEAGDKYRMAVKAFTEEAKGEVSSYLESKIAQAEKAIIKTNEEQRAAMQEAARLAFRSEAADKAEGLLRVLSEASKEFQKSLWIRVIEYGSAAVIASLLTAYLMRAR